MKILFKIPTRSRPNHATELVNSIVKNVYDKNNFLILLTCDKDDNTTYNYDFITSIKPLIDSKKLILCFDESKSRIDAINRDMKLVEGFDILVYVPDDTEFNVFGFDESIRKLYQSQFDDTNGKVYYEVGAKKLTVLGKELYQKQGYILNPNKSHNLIINYYTDKNDARNQELKFCVSENLKNEYIDNIVLILSENDYNQFKNTFPPSQKIIPIITEIRPTYNDYFRIMRKLFDSENNINIISNLDIIIPKESLIQSKNGKCINDYLTNKSTCLALTRWDIIGADTTGTWNNNIQLFDTPDSQDTWVFLGGVNQITGADFTLGLAGCDNSIAHLLEVSGYNVLNPSRTIKTYHFHLTNIRNYTNVVGHAIERIPPPYKLLHPTE